MIFGAFLVVAVIAAVLIYPGELSQVSGRSHRWLYDRAARGYERKWLSPPYLDRAYADRIGEHAAAARRDSGNNRILDLGCGTGRGVRITAASLPDDAAFTCVDFSPRMLEEFRAWLSNDRSLVGRVTLVESSVGEWANSADRDTESYGLVLLLEVAEFLPDFARVVERVSARTASRGGLVMTRPAGLWSWAFPGRSQSRRGLRRLLAAHDYAEIDFVAWRSRYELVLARKR